MENWQKKIETLEFHQQLLLRMLKNSKEQLYYLIIQKKLTKSETEQLLKLCDDLSIELERQKAEGFVTFYPLLTELKANLHPAISSEELVDACIQQGIYTELMRTIQPLLKE
ncbi:MAG: DUF1878 family protein [Bacillus sp. (in: firmicutes)]